MQRLSGEESKLRQKTELNGSLSIELPSEVALKIDSFDINERQLNHKMNDLDSTMSRSPADLSPLYTAYRRNNTWVAKQTVSEPYSLMANIKPPVMLSRTEPHQSDINLSKYVASKPKNERNEFGAFQALKVDKRSPKNKKYEEKFAQQKQTEHSQRNGLSTEGLNNRQDLTYDLEKEPINKYAVIQLGLQRRNPLSDPMYIPFDRLTADNKRVKQEIKTACVEKQLPEDQFRINLTNMAPYCSTSRLPSDPGNQYFQNTQKLKDVQIPMIEPVFEPQYMSPRRRQTQNSGGQGHDYQTPERSKKRNLTGDISMQRISEERFIDEEDARSIRKREIALNNDYFKSNIQNCESKRPPQIAFQSDNFSEPNQTQTPNITKRDHSNMCFHTQQNPYLIGRNNMFSFDNPPDSFLKHRSAVTIPRTNRLVLGTPLFQQSLRRERSNSMHVSLNPENDLKEIDKSPHSKESPLINGTSPDLLDKNFDFEENFRESREKLVRIGKGSFSVIYKFENRCDKSDYVVKRLNDLHRGIRESQITDYIRNKCYSRYLVRFYYSWLAENTVNILLEKCEETAIDCISKHKDRLTEEDVIVFLRSMGEALAELHSAQVVHLDVKPDNVLISADGCFKLADFGHSRRLDSDEDLKHIEEGDFDYTPAEFTGGIDVSDVREHRIDLTKVDIFSLGLSGLVLLSIIKGVPMTKDDREQIRVGNSVLIGQLGISSTKLRERLLAMLQREPTKRPTARALLDGWETRQPDVPSHLRLSIFE